MAEADGPGPADVDWETCRIEGCIGVRLPDAPACWSHAGEAQMRDALADLGEHGALDGRGITFTSELLRALLDAAPRGPSGRHPQLAGVMCERCTFPEEARLANVEFTGDVDFTAATFGDIAFDQVQFAGHVTFDGARFRGAVGVTESTFRRMCSFDRAECEQGASFTHTSFGSVSFVRTRFRGTASFHQSNVDGDAQFFEARFEDSADFRGVTFAHHAEWTNAWFDGQASFFHTSHAESVTFDGATFGDILLMSDVAVDGVASFIRTRFRRSSDKGPDASFGPVRFGTLVTFAGASAAGDLHFRDTTFAGDVQFTDAEVHGDLVLGNATFASTARLGGLRCQGDVSFVGATFDTVRELGPFSAGGAVHMDRTTWREQAFIQVAAARLSCRWARFLSGGLIAVYAGSAEPSGDEGDAGLTGDEPLFPTEILLEDADLAAPSILTVAHSLPELGLEATPDLLRPQLLSLTRANVAGLTVSALDLSRCQFARVHNLDKMRLDDVVFERVRIFGRRRFRYVIDEVRHVIAEERLWRATHARGLMRTAWATPHEHEPDVLHASQIAGIYRELRKGSEDRGDEPGAADFYYGEMEMRRHATSRRHRDTAERSAAAAAGEHVILTLYWLLSGYGLRAWRALVSLAVVVMLGGWAFAAWGMEDVTPDDGGTAATPAAGDPVVGEPGFSRGLLVSARAATAVLSSPDVALTTFGAWLHVVLRLVGPVLLGLAVVSIRGRVKR